MPRNRKAVHPVISSSLTRAFSLVPTAVATLAATRLILEHYDRGVFNTYVLVFSTMILIPLNNLGAGTAVTSAFAEAGPDAPESRRVLLTAARVMVVSGLALAVVALSVTLLGLWPELLGSGVASSTTFGLAMVAYALSFVPGLAQSVLLGLNRNHLTVLVQGFLAPAMFLGVVIAVWLDADPGVVIVVPALAVAVLAVVNAWVSARATGVHLLPLLAKIPRPRRFPGTRIRSVAGPALIINLALPLSLQSDRLVLSHFSTKTDLTNYSIAVQIFAPVLAVVAAAAQPLWPIFTKRRADGTRPPSMSKLMLLFGVFSVLACGGLVVLSGPISHVIGGADTDLGVALPVFTGILVAGQAITLPIAMALKDAEGLRLVAKCAVVALPLNLALSMILAPRLGAPGPLVATISVGLVAQGAPSIVHYWRRQQSFPPPTGPGAPVNGSRVLPAFGDVIG